MSHGIEKEFSPMHGEVAGGRSADRTAAGPTGVPAGAHDITELHDGDERFRIAVEAMPAGMVMVDANGRIVLVNSETLRLFGYSRDELQDQPIELLVPRRNRGQHVGVRTDYVNQASARLMGAGRDLFGLRKDGSEFPVEIGLRPVQTSDGPCVIAVVTDLTARKSAEELFRVAVEASPSGMIVVDEDACIVLSNAEATRLFGYSREELLGQTIEMLVPQRHRQGHVGLRRSYTQSATARLMGEGRNLFALRKDGTEFPVEIGLRPVVTSSGRSVIAVVTDLTRRLREEELFRAAVEASPTGMIVVDRSGRLVLANGEAQRLFGYTRDELVGRPLEILVPERHQTQHVHLRSDYVRAADSRPMGVGRDLAGRRKDGSEFPLEIGLQPVTISTGVLVIAAVTDLTARKAADAMREEMERTRAHLAAIVEFSEDAVMSKDRDGLITSWNAGAERLLGYTAAEILGKPVRQIIPIERREEEAEILRQLLAGEPVRQFDTVRVRKDGKLVPVSVTISPIKNTLGEIVGASKIARDISARKRAETDLRARSDELVRSNSELQQFAYSASHDLAEPLRAISGFMQLLKKRYGSQLDERADEYINHAVDGASRMHMLLDGLLAYSRLGSGEVEKEPVDCNELLTQVLQNLRASIDESAACMDVQPLPIVSGNAARLIILFQNLIGNAIKFRRAVPPVIRVTCDDEGTEHRFSVSDNGIGIDGRHFDRIFGVFQRLHTRDQYPGTGIGLALCAKIVALHGGRLWVESKLGEGSTFRFTIPNSAPMSMRGR